MLERYLYMGKPKAGKPGYVCPAQDNRLFKASYLHVGGLNCNDCAAGEQVERDARKSSEPEIHYSLIASGNTLVKDAAVRDKVLQITGGDCICLEMKAAGLINTFPCLVIRGISDYADSHKNDHWQRYTAATAAAYAKKFLGIIQGEDLEITEKAIDILEKSE